MRYLYQTFRCGWLIFFFTAVGLTTSATAGGISPGPVANQRFATIGKLVLGRVWLFASVPSGKSKGLPVYPLAYVDPGSGQLIWQMVLAGCVGALFYVKRLRAYLVRLVDKWFKKKD